MASGGSDYYESIWYYSPVFTTYRKRLATIEWNWDYRTILRYRPGRGLRLLDIGCGAGEFLYLARQRYGYEVAGVERNQHLVRLAREVYSLETAICASWPEAAETLGAGSFDLATMLHVVEHLEDPVGAMRSAARALKPDGLLGIAVPAHERRPRLVAGTRNLPPHHLTLWSEGSLVRAFAAAGLGTVYVGRAPFSAADVTNYLQDRFTWLRGPLPSRLLWVVGRRLIAPGVALAHALSLTVGYSVVGIARRGGVGEVS